LQKINFDLVNAYVTSLLSDSDATSSLLAT
jgi:hypothetical protein